MKKFKVALERISYKDKLEGKIEKIFDFVHEEGGTVLDVKPFISEQFIGVLVEWEKPTLVKSPSKKAAPKKAKLEEVSAS
jgi:hypothetical protein